MEDEHTHTHLCFYHQVGTIERNEVLQPSVGLSSSSDYKMHLPLSPIISCLIEDNITRQWVLLINARLQGVLYGTCHSVRAGG